MPLRVRSVACLVVEFAGEQRVVADYDTAVGDYERAGSVAALALSGVAVSHWSSASFLDWNLEGSWREGS